MHHTSPDRVREGRTIPLNVYRLRESPQRPNRRIYREYDIKSAKHGQLDPWLHGQRERPTIIPTQQGTCCWSYRLPYLVPFLSIRSLPSATQGRSVRPLGALRRGGGCLGAKHGQLDPWLHGQRERPTIIPTQQGTCCWSYRLPYLVLFLSIRSLPSATQGRSVRPLGALRRGGGYLRYLESCSTCSSLYWLLYARLQEGHRPLCHSSCSTRGNNHGGVALCTVAAAAAASLVAAPAGCSCSALLPMQFPGIRTRIWNDTDSGC